MIANPAPTAHKRIAYSTFILAIISFSGNVLSMGKEMIVAAFFGVTSGMDAFYAAATIPTMAINIILTTLGTVFIPLYTKYLSINNQEADNFASTLISYSIIALSLLSLAIYWAAPALINGVFGGLSYSAIAVAVHVLRILSVSALLSGLVCIGIGILNAHDRFAWPALSQYVITLATIGTVLLFSGRIHVYTLAYGMVIGLMLQLILLIPSLRNTGFTFNFSLRADHPAFKELTVFASFLLIATIVTQVNTFVDRAMTAHLGSGSIAAYGYAEKIFSFPTLIFSSSLITVLFPHMSRQIADRDFPAIRDSLSSALSMSAFFFFPLACIGMALTYPAIAFLFQRGLFAPQATQITSSILLYFCFTYFVFFISTIFMRLLFAFQAGLPVLIIYSIHVFANIIINYACIQFITPAVSGIALSKAFGNIITLVLTVIFLKRRLGALNGTHLIISMSRLLLFSAISGLIAWVCSTQLSHTLVDNRLNTLINLILSSGAGLGIFVLLNHIFKSTEYTRLSRLIRTYFREAKEGA